MTNDFLVWCTVLISINLWVLMFFVGKVIDELIVIRKVLTFCVNVMPTREQLDMISEFHLRKETRCR